MPNIVITTLLILTGDDATNLWIAGIIIFVVIVALAYYSQWRQFQMLADPERYVLGSPQARASIHQAIGNKKIITELSGMDKSYIAVTEDAVYLANSISSGLGSAKGVNIYPIDSISGVNVREITKITFELEIVIPGAAQSIWVHENKNKIRFTEPRVPREKVQELANAILEIRRQMLVPS